MLAAALKESARVVLPVAAAVAGASFMASASDEVVPAPHYPFTHKGPFSSWDTKSIRRGYQVYKEVCASCHSMKYMHYRDLVGVCYSENEAKFLAEQIEVEDGPNDDGEMFERPGKLADTFPAPYENEEQARAINNGALPPDLSLIAKARHGGEDYLFALLTGYREAPAGVTVNEEAGQYYNPYFPGSKIGMPLQLIDGAVEYDDGTVATASQMAKDVCSFLAWAAEPRQDQRKKYGQQVLTLFAICAVIAGYNKRFRWAPIKTSKISYFK